MHGVPSPSGYSDFQLHTFCLHNYVHLGRYCLPPDALLSSGKLKRLDTLLRELKDKGSRCARWGGVYTFGHGQVVVISCAMRQCLVTLRRKLKDTGGGWEPPRVVCV